MTIGLIGLGRMGLAMARRLVEAGVEVVAWDIDARCRDAAQAAGAAVAADPAAVAQRAGTVLSIVTDDAAVRWVFTAQRGLLAGDVEGKLFVEMTTLQPQTMREIAGLVEGRGGHVVGAPVLGSIPTVREGKLLVLAGGRAVDVARARTALAPLARDVLHLGPVGAGNAMKLIVNLSMAAYLQALAEGLALGEREGLDLVQMLAVMAEAPTANGWLAAKRPVLTGEPADVTLDIAALRKDMMSAVATGAFAGVPMPLAAGVLATLSAAVAAGHGFEDLAQMPRFFREQMVRRSTPESA